MSVSRVPFLGYSVLNNGLTLKVAWVRGHSRSLQLVPFEILGAVFYSSSIVTIALCCIVSEIKRDIRRKADGPAVIDVKAITDIGGESQFCLPNATAFDAPVRRVPSEYCHHVWCGQTRMVWLSDGEKNWSHVYSLWQNRRTWQMDRQTDTARRHTPRLCIASHGKKSEKCAIVCVAGNGGRLEYDNSMVVSMEINGLMYQGVLFAQHPHRIWWRHEHLPAWRHVAVTPDPHYLFGTMTLMSGLWASSACTVKV